LAPYRGEDLSFFSDVEDCDQPAPPLNDMERCIVHEAAEAIRYNSDPERHQQRAQSPLIFRACRDPQTSIRTMCLSIIFKRFGAVAQIEADTDEPHPIGKAGSPYLVPELGKRLAERNTDRGARRIQGTSKNSDLREFVRV